MDFEEFWRDYSPSLGRLSAALTGNRERAQDLLADAIVKCWTHWPHVQRADDQVAYVRKIIYRTFLSDQRREARRKVINLRSSATLEQEGNGSDPDHSDYEHLRVQLDSLPRSQAAALMMRYYLELSDAAIAKQLNTSEATVRSWISRGLKSLRIEMEPYPLPTEGNR